MKADNFYIHTANKEDLARIRPLGEDDLQFETSDRLNLAHLLIAEERDLFVGYLQYGLFQNKIPFMHKLFVTSDYRGKGYATMLIREWEQLMSEHGYECVMLTTSSLSSTQNFYHLMGYRDIGSFMLPDEPLQIILYKHL